MVYYRKKARKKTAIIVVVAFLGLVGIFLALELSGKTSIFTNREPSTSSDAKTTSELPSAQPDFSEGEEREPGNTLQEDEGTAVITDTGGAPSSDTSQAISSVSGEITIHLPTANSTVLSGQEIAGTSSLSTIQYRVIDSTTGVIATGKLKVIGGKFSGKLSFTTNAREGRIDIFAARDDGTEYSNLEIPVRFQ